MSNNQHWYLICYDIRNPKRLNKTHRWLRRQALMLQESVYLYQGDLKEAAALRQALKKRIDVQVDDVRIYQLAAHAELMFYAQSPWGNDLFLSGLPDWQVVPVDVNTPCPEPVHHAVDSSSQAAASQVCKQGSS
ncbi:CRISPR-associated endonuclease Cas2 [Rheinheimera sp.]|uniref:CRISPR-associated endonuclease Cas2 n=1 Tax=Rheinheimera sp. TaxID=1869214 RepID=UPI003AF7BE3C